jgi:hypothetical protein
LPLLRPSRSTNRSGESQWSGHLALQNGNLLPERGILCLKLKLRLGCIVLDSLSESQETEGFEG